MDDKIKKRIERLGGGIGNDQHWVLLMQNRKAKVWTQCPVCGYPNLPSPLAADPICPSCLTEFGYDNEMATIDELRDRWVADGMPWRGSAAKKEPPDWDPARQLASLDGKPNKEK